MKILIAIILIVVGAWAWLFLSNKGVGTEDRVGKFTESLGFQGIRLDEQRLVCTYFTGAGMYRQSHTLALGERTCLNVIDLR